MEDYIPESPKEKSTRRGSEIVGDRPQNHKDSDNKAYISAGRRGSLSFSYNEVLSE